MPEPVKLDEARVRSAKGRAERELAAARLSERAALAARAKAAKLAEVWGFYVYRDEVGDGACCVPDEYNHSACLRPKGHEGDHRSGYKQWG